MTSDLIGFARGKILLRFHSMDICADFCFVLF